MTVFSQLGLQNKQASNLKNTFSSQQNSTDYPSIFSTHETLEFGRNEEVFSSHVSKPFIYFILSGKIQVCIGYEQCEQSISHYYGEGDFINLDMLLSEKRMIVATSKSKKTKLIRLTMDKFMQYFNTNSELQKLVFSQLSQDKKAMENRYFKLWQTPSCERIRDFICQHTLKFGQRVGYEMVLRDTLTHKEIADHVCASRQTVTVVMNELRAKGIFHFNRKYWIIRDMEALKKMTVC